MAEKEAKKKVGGFSKFLNFFWIVLFGLWATIWQVIVAVVYMVTLLGIPNGLALFRTLRILWHPFGRKAVLHFRSHVFLNVWWLIWFGWVSAVIHYVVGAVFCITIIGIPIGLQIFKLAKAYWAPHGVTLEVI